MRKRAEEKFQSEILDQIQIEKSQYEQQNKINRKTLTKQIWALKQEQMKAK